MGFVSFITCIAAVTALLDAYSVVKVIRMRRQMVEQIQRSQQQARLRERQRRWALISRYSMPQIDSESCYNQERQDDDESPPPYTDRQNIFTVASDEESPPPYTNRENVFTEVSDKGCCHSIQGEGSYSDSYCEGANCAKGQVVTA